MKNTGVVRRVDGLGRIVIPKEVRRTLNIDSGVALGISVDNDRIILSRYHEKCILCSKQGNLKNFKGKLVCQNCIDAIKKGI